MSFLEMSRSDISTISIYCNLLKSRPNSDRYGLKVPSWWITKECYWPQPEANNIAHWPNKQTGWVAKKLQKKKPEKDEKNISKNITYVILAQIKIGNQMKLQHHLIVLIFVTIYLIHLVNYPSIRQRLARSHNLYKL